MEAAKITLRGENADRYAAELTESKANEAKHSINKWGVRNIHRFEGEGFTHLAYERGSAHEESWLMVSVLVEQIDDRTCTVVVFVGGGGEGAFKWEDVTVKRLLEGPEAVGQAGRFFRVVEEVEEIARSLDLEVEARWISERDRSLPAKIKNELFGSGGDGDGP